MVYIEFIETKDTGKTKKFCVNSKTGCYLGVVSWYSGWRRYVFKPESETIFDSKCMLEIIEFINELMNDRRK